ncbi:Uncharacterised protein [Serratia odorifera]|nr:Uncharacterised protein [Serratia odorifera]
MLPCEHKALLRNYHLKKEKNSLRKSHIFGEGFQNIWQKCLMESVGIQRRRMQVQILMSIISDLKLKQKEPKR